ncbi:arf-GAP with Rho-GAP domain, ANK repeat and PH domain-containing protein 1 isoform X3 [Ambystoma mexicanum]|uniref:arf-GAP with Rho-GAP domain, ANK repeat and PH domain-containing protein 1 isoform X3 n=1 Tax=Ambystoma mexicanum TaxID=8296 RepID=UPI0037E849F4
MEGPSPSVHDWLESLHLDQYKDIFEKNDYRTLSDCKLLSDKGLAQIGVLLPGHRKRILSGIEKCFSEGLSGEWCEESPISKLQDIPKQTDRPVPKPRTQRPATSNSSPGSQAIGPITDLSVLPPVGLNSNSVRSSNLSGPRQPRPPIPPRAGCRPPVKFSTGPSLNSTDFIPPALQSSVGGHTYAFVNLPQNSSATTIVCDVSTPKDESMGDTPIPPREGCRPPVKFSTGPSLNSRDFIPPALQSPVVAQTYAFVNLPQNSSATTIVCDVSTTKDQSMGETLNSDVPPLPAKRSVERKKPVLVAGPPVPSRQHILPPRILSPRKPVSPSPPPPSKVEPTGADKQLNVPPPIIPRVKSLHSSVTSGIEPAMNFIRHQPEFDIPDYEDIEVTFIGVRPLDVSDKSEVVAMREGPLPKPHSYPSDDDTIEDESDGYEDVTQSDVWTDGSLNLLQSSDSLSSGTFGMYSSIMDEASNLPSSVIKAGWLDKNPPQGSYIYQKRWVKLDSEYLRYYDSDKEMYSKRFIPVTSISRVAGIGDQKFEVMTNNRNFVFRAESDVDRSDWVRVFEQIIRDRRYSYIQSGSLAVDNPDKAGLLDLRGYKSKPYVVVSGEKVFIYRNAEDFRMGIGITMIEMNVGNVKDVDRRGFDLTTPYRIFSFTADSDTEKEEWVEAMQQSIAEALSNWEVAEKIWSLAANRQCADCGAPNPEWASVNLCVVFCKTCAGEHRSLGPGVSKVRSLKMDRKVWTKELIQLFHRIGNAVANQFWAANVPPSEAIYPLSITPERKRFITAKYKEGKYRRYHQLFGNQEELNKALCATVTTSDLAESLALVFCGAEVGCDSGDPAFPNPSALAEQAGQRLQMEFLLHNKNSELPRLDLGNNMEKQYYVARPSITHNGFLHKTASMGKAINERKSREEFSRRWCVLNDGVLSYFESDRNPTPNGEIKMSEIVCLVVNPSGTHGYESTFEVYTESERLYLFGLDNAAAAKEWVKSIAKSFISSRAEELLVHDFERIGRLQYMGGLGLASTNVGWFALVQSTLYACLEESEKEEVIHLKKLHELSIKGDNDVLVLVEKNRLTNPPSSRMLYIQGEKKLHFSGWVSAIQKAAGTSGDTLSGQQLTDADIPVIVYKCIDFITQYGLTSEGIYRKSGQNSKTTNLLDLFNKDARKVWLLKDGDHQVDDVANTLKRFFRYIGVGIFTEDYRDWLNTTAINYEDEKICHYQRLLKSLPPVNKATLKALINHLYRVQRFSSSNQMNTHNLAIVFGPTLFQSDGQDNKAGQVVEDLINHYVEIFSVDEEELRKQQDEIDAITKIKEACQPIKTGGKDGGHFICAVYFEEKSEDRDQNIKIPATMTADQLTFEILERRQVQRKEKDCWSCFEVNEKEETERPLHYCEKVLPIYMSLGTDGYLVVKKHLSMEAMLIYLASKVGETKHGMMKFREEKSLMGMALSTGSFHDRYFILNSSSLRLYKEVRNPRRQSVTSENSHRPEKEWPVKNITIYLGIKKKFRPPTCWGFTMMYENERHDKSLWYICCDTQLEMREWFATFLHVQHGGNVWPLESAKVRVSRIHQDSSCSEMSESEA